MREIKFRAWHHGGGDTRVEPRMAYSSEFAPAKYFWESLDNEVFSYELMQYTGLKDKNGKEIYEGDIINYFGKTDAMHFGVCTTEVRFDEHRCGFAPMSWWVSQTNRDVLEVIGNIYENPELLK